MKTILNIKHLASILVLGAAMTLMTIPPLSAEPTNLVTNGSFEEPSASCIGTFTELSFGSTLITDWFVSGQGVDWICSHWEASDGNYSVDLNKVAPGAVLQSMALEVGAEYDVSFDLAGNPHCGPVVKDMTVLTVGVAESFAFDTTGKTFTDMGYETKTFSFTADFPLQQLIFRSDTTFACGPVIDNVIVQKSVPAVILLEIDIKPGSDVNPVNTKSKGVIPVAVLSTADFDASTIDPSTIAFGPNGATESHGKAHFEDVNNDGLVDMVLHFKTQESGIMKGDADATLTGSTFDGTAIEGTDVITTK